ncbi:hypothetical protein E2C01_009262 [Portunus trituberculatus]|uniref:Uncharacterized protein n=1 Tax=Portunus trituberculatus TaxID=210409 RepID=A0A5B7D4E3_PORTR|nr:hypothetical protein [Portunus trituberculatus]
MPQLGQLPPQCSSSNIPNLQRTENKEELHHCNSYPEGGTRCSSSSSGVPDLSVESGMSNV